MNPFLWYLVDRSKPGLLLSTAVAVAGSAVMLGITGPNMLPAPLATAGRWRWQQPDDDGNRSAAAVLKVATGDVRATTGSTVGSGETTEAAIWMLSVLFCSCVCFGNIGRRLALRRPLNGLRTAGVERERWSWWR